MTHPLHEGARKLTRRFREERRANSSLSGEQFLDALRPGDHDFAGIARSEWIELLDVARNAPEGELDALVGEWLQRHAMAATLQVDAPAQSGDSEATLPSPAPPPAQDAQFIDRRYRIVRVLGEGAFGKVFLVQDKLQNDQELALKLIKKEHTATSEALVRFKNEILLLRVLNHPGIPQIFNDGISEDGEFYYTMAYVSGRTLDDVIRKEAPLDPLRIVRITKQVLDVLDYAHARGAIHRDLKPGNIFLVNVGTPKEQVRVLDFGIAKVLSREGILEHAQTMNTEMPLGTPHYMSPEQVRGTEVDGRTDLYALGVILYQMCSGRFPFSGKTLMEILAARLERPPNPLEDATTPEWLRQLVMKLLEREREHRPDTTAIRVMLEGMQGTQRAMSRTLSLVAAAVVAIAGVLVWYGFSGPKEQDTTTAKAPAGEVESGPGGAGEESVSPENSREPGGENPGGAEKQDVGANTPPDASAAGPDSDGDGTPDAKDDCPNDPLKQVPGFCGCGKPETDTDGDGFPDCVDLCKLDPNKTTPGECGCGVPDTDTDGDGVPDCKDAFVQDKTRWKPEEPVANAEGSKPNAAARLPSGCVAAEGATVDDRGRVSAIVHEKSGMTLELVQAGSASFYLGRTEVTRDEWARGPLASEVKLPAAPPGEKSGQHPASNMTLDQAQEFCERMGLRLPTGEEWDRAAGLAGRAYPWGDEFAAGSCNANGPEDGFAQSAPVGSFAADRCGPFFDLAGNVQEWCTADGKAALRGGGWRSAPVACRLKAPTTAPKQGGVSIGFRAAVSCEP